MLRNKSHISSQLSNRFDQHISLHSFSSLTELDENHLGTQNDAYFLQEEKFDCGTQDVYTFVLC